MRHHIFIPDYQFQKVYYVSLGNNFFTVFMEAPLVVEALGNCPACPLLNPVLDMLIATSRHLTLVGS